MNIGPESEFVEHKRSTGEHKEACESITAMLNRHGRGEIYFGVANDGTVVGQDVSDRTVRDLGEEIDHKIAPAVRPAIDTLSTPEGLTYLRVSFAGDDGPYACDGRYRVRVGDRDKLMTPYEVEQAFKERSNRLDPWDARPSRRSLADVDEGAVRSYIERGREKGRIGFEYEGVEDALVRTRLLREGALTNAAEILFCEPEYAMLKMGIFATPARVEVFDMKHPRCNLFEMADAAEQYVLRNIKWRFEFNHGITRVEIPEIPKDVVREAVVNALCHRDWQDGMAVQIDIFPTHVDIFNPGHFPAGVSPEELLAGEEPYSESPNKLLAAALYQCGDIESHGTGIARMRDLCEEFGVGMSYETTKHGTILRLVRPNWEKDGAAGIGERGKRNVMGPEAASEAVLRSLTGTEAAAYSYLFEHGVVSAGEMAQALAKSPSHTRRILSSLVGKGLARRTGANKGTLYSPADTSDKRAINER